MNVFRLATSKYCLDLSGKGAQKSGGRWNSSGTSIVYTSKSRALCTSEIAVHLPLGILPTNFELVTIEIPDSVKINELEIKDLPADWDLLPHSGTTQALGDVFVKENKFAVLKAPSVVVHGDFNYLINPNHKDFNKIKVLKTEKFDFDQQLFFK